MLIVHVATNQRTHHFSHNHSSSSTVGHHDGDHGGSCHRSTTTRMPIILTHQLLLSWYCRYNATTHQPLLVVHTAGQHDILHPGLSNVKCHQILSPTTFITNLPLSMGHTTILTVTDRFSKACRPENLIRVISRKLMATTERGDLERGTRTSAMACSQNEGAG